MKIFNIESYGTAYRINVTDGTAYNNLNLNYYFNLEEDEYRDILIKYYGSTYHYSKDWFFTIFKTIDDAQQLIDEFCIPNIVMLKLTGKSI